LNLRRRAYARIARRAQRVHGRGPVLVAIGDSHTDPSTGYTLPRQVWLRRVGRVGYRTVNLGVSGDTTSDMRQRMTSAVLEARPDIAVLFGGSNDPARQIDPAQTRENVTFMVEWLRSHGAARIVLFGAELPHGSAAALDDVRAVLRDVADQYELVFVDLARCMPDGDSNSWHVADGDPHFNAYGQRLIAEAFLAATADWRTS
jgi:lysophospholipase L1-like esterase